MTQTTRTKYIKFQHSAAKIAQRQPLSQTRIFEGQNMSDATKTSNRCVAPRSEITWENGETVQPEDIFKHQARLPTEPQKQAKKNSQCSDASSSTKHQSPTLQSFGQPARFQIRLSAVDFSLGIAERSSHLLLHGFYRPTAVLNAMHSANINSRSSASEIHGIKINSRNINGHW